MFNIRETEEKKAYKIKIRKEICDLGRLLFVVVLLFLISFIWSGFMNFQNNVSKIVIIKIKYSKYEEKNHFFSRCQK